MRTSERAQLIVHLWHKEGIEERRYLSDVPYTDLAPEHRIYLNKHALLYAKGWRIIPMVVVRNGERIQIW